MKGSEHSIAELSVEIAASPSVIVTRLLCRGSPPWHRHARLRRSKAKRRVRTAKLNFQTPARRDLALLAAHHGHTVLARPPMGGKKTWNQGDYGARQQGGSWAYWHGSYQARSPKSAFLAYDRSRQDSWQQRGRETEPNEAPTFTQALQGSLNGTRKMEQRVHSLQDGLARRQEMWELYLRDMKDALRREQTRFTRDMERLRGDLDQALLNQEAACAELLRVAALAGRAPERPPPDNRAERLISAWCAEEPDNDAQSILRRAMAATGDMPSASPATGNAGPPPGLVHMPPPGHMGVDAFMDEVDALAGQSTSPPPPATGEVPASPAFGGFRPPDADAYAGPAMRDPYLPSPGQTALRACSIGVAPAATWPIRKSRWRYCNSPRWPRIFRPPGSGLGGYEGSHSFRDGCSADDGKHSANRPLQASGSDFHRGRRRVECTTRSGWGGDPRRSLAGAPLQRQAVGGGPSPRSPVTVCCLRLIGVSALRQHLLPVAPWVQMAPLGLLPMRCEPPDPV